MSRSVSSEPDTALGAPGPPSTLSTMSWPVRFVCEMLSQKYSGAPGSTAARVTMPTVWPEPSARAYSGSRLYIRVKS
jgi:hypothetical protein